jgi:hypothetical protein
MARKLGPSKVLILEALINKDDNITALEGGRFKTTRITNQINKLRKMGLLIHTQMVRSDSGKAYGKYRLVDNVLNRKRANEILQSLKESVA